MEGYHHIEIPEKGHSLYLPTELAYCDTRQYVEFNELLYRWQAGIITYEDLRIQAIYKLLNLVKSKEESNKIDQEHKFSNIYMLSELVDSFFDKNDKNQSSVKLNFTHNPMRVIKPILTVHQGPDPYFKNVNFGQYVDALNLYCEYAVHKERNLLLMLLGTLYLPNYNPKTIETDCLNFEKWPIGFAYGAYNFFGAFQTFLVASEVSWEGRNIDIAMLFKDDNATGGYKSPIPGLGMKSIGYQLAETGVFGDYEKVRNTPLWEVILRLYDITKRDKDALAQQKLAEKKQK